MTYPIKLKTHAAICILLPACILFLQSCGEVADDFYIDAGYAYFQKVPGQVSIFRIDSIVFDPVDNQIIKDSSTTFVREVVLAAETDSSGSTEYIIERSERKDTNVRWEVKDIWTARLHKYTATRTEENLTFVKLVFPVRVGQRWSSTVFIDDSMTLPVAGEQMQIFKGWHSVILSEGQPDIINNKNYEAVTTVQHAEEENAIERRYYLEKYVKGIGLAFREMEILDTQCVQACIGQSWVQKAEKGFIIRQVLIDFQ